MKQNVKLQDNYVVKSIDFERIEKLVCEGDYDGIIDILVDIHNRCCTKQISGMELFIQLTSLLSDSYSTGESIKKLISIYENIILNINNQDVAADYLPFVYNLLGHALIKNREITAAKEAFEKSLEMQINKPEKSMLLTKILMIEVYRQLGLLPQAIDVAEICIKALEIENPSEMAFYMSVEEFLLEYKKRDSIKV